MSGIANWQAQIRIDIEDLKKRIKVAEGEINNFTNEDRKLKLDIDTKTLESAIQKLDKMLDSIGKGTGDFKQFENLSKELSSIVSEVQSLSKAFGKVDDSGTKTLLSSIQSIDKSLSELSQNILNVNKNMGNMGVNTNGAVKQVENISNAYQNAAKEAEKLADAQSKIGQKMNISSGSNPTIEQQNKLQEELKETQQQAEKARQAVSELVKGRDVVSQNWYREKGTVVGKDSKGNDITRDADEFSFVERLKNGQLQTVLATYNEETGKWAEQIINVRTAFEQVEKAIISADNKIASLEMTKKKTLVAHPGYDTTADDNQITIERKKRDELQNTLNLYGQEKEYIFEIEAANKRIADNQERLNNKKQSKANLQATKESETIEKQLQKEIEASDKANQKKFQDFQKEQANYEESVNKVNSAIQKTDEILDNLPLHDKLDGQFLDMIDSVDNLNSKLKSGELTLSEYKNEVKSVTSEFSKMVSIQQKRDVEDYNANAKADNAKKLEREKQIWNELTTSLERYSTIQKRIASNNALSTDNEEATKLLEHIHELQRNDILPTEKLTASNEKLQQINQTVTDLKAKLKESTLNSLQGSIDKYQKIITQAQTYPSDFHPSTQYNTTLAKLESENEILKNYKASLQGVNELTKDQQATINKLTQNCEKAATEFKKLSAAEKGTTEVGIEKAIQRINKDLAENTKYSAEAKAGLNALLVQLKSGDPSINLRKITEEIIRIENAEIAAGRAGKSLWDIFKTKSTYGFIGQMQSFLSMYVGFYGMINAAKKVGSTLVELDTTLVDLKKTTTMSSSELENFYYDSNDIAKQMGVTTQAIIDQASAWSRLGYSTKEQSETMAKLSSQFASISPGMDTDEAQQGLVSIMKAWDIDPNDVKSQIMDKINILGNTMAESNQDIVEGMERSAAALAAVGTSTEDAFAMFSGIQEVLQNAEKSGTALRSLSMRVRGYDESTEQLSSDLSNITGELADLTKTAEHTQGVSIFKDGSTTEFKDLTEYFKEINNIWDEMSQKQQNDFLQKAFGKTQAQAGAALIQNYKGVAKALEEMKQSAGNSDKEMDTVKSSLEYKLNALQETWTGTIQNIMKRSDLGFLIDGLTKLSEGIGTVTSNLGLLKTAALGVTAVLSARNNVGKCYVSA